MDHMWYVDTSWIRASGKTEPRPSVEGTQIEPPWP